MNGAIAWHSSRAIRGRLKLNPDPVLHYGQLHKKGRGIRPSGQAYCLATFTKSCEKSNQQFALNLQNHSAKVRSTMHLMGSIEPGTYYHPRFLEHAYPRPFTGVSVT